MTYMTVKIDKEAADSAREMMEQVKPLLAELADTLGLEKGLLEAFPGLQEMAIDTEKKYIALHMGQPCILCDPDTGKLFPIIPQALTVTEDIRATFNREY